MHRDVLWNRNETSLVTGWGSQVYAGRIGASGGELSRVVVRCREGREKAAECAVETSFYEGGCG